MKSIITGFTSEWSACGGSLLHHMNISTRCTLLMTWGQQLLACLYRGLYTTGMCLVYLRFMVLSDPPFPVHFPPQNNKLHAVCIHKTRGIYSIMYASNFSKGVSYRLRNPTHTHYIGANVAVAPAVALYALPYQSNESATEWNMERIIGTGGPSWH